MNWPEEVRGYLAIKVFSDASLPEPDDEGRITLSCPERRHQDAWMDVRTGAWGCPGCKSFGNLEDYELRRSGGGYWKAAKSIREALATFRSQEEQRAEDRARQAKAHAAALGATHQLSDPARRLLKTTILSPGISRTKLQRGAHLPRVKFRDALRELLSHALIRPEYLPSTAGRKRKSYFAVDR
jgi:hypothetical protein